MEEIRERGQDGNSVVHWGLGWVVVLPYHLHPFEHALSLSCRLRARHKVRRYSHAIENRKKLK